MMEKWLIFNSINYSISQQSKQREKAAVCDFISLVMFFLQQMLPEIIVAFPKQKATKKH